MVRSHSRALRAIAACTTERPGCRRWAGRRTELHSCDDWLEEHHVRLRHAHGRSRSSTHLVAPARMCCHIVCRGLTTPGDFPTSRTSRPAAISRRPSIVSSFLTFRSCLSVALMRLTPVGPCLAAFGGCRRSARLWAALSSLDHCGALPHFTEVRHTLRLTRPVARDKWLVEASRGEDQSWAGRGQSRRRFGRGEPGPDADMWLRRTHLHDVPHEGTLDSNAAVLRDCFSPALLAHPPLARAILVITGGRIRRASEAMEYPSERRIAFGPMA